MFLTDLFYLFIYLILLFFLNLHFQYDTIDAFKGVHLSDTSFLRGSRAVGSTPSPSSSPSKQIWPLQESVTVMFTTPSPSTHFSLLLNLDFLNCCIITTTANCRGIFFKLNLMPFFSQVQKACRQTIEYYLDGSRTHSVLSKRMSSSLHRPCLYQSAPVICLGSALLMSLWYNYPMLVLKFI